MARILDMASGAVRVAFTPQILLMVSKVYIPILFPVTFLIALCSRTLDIALDPVFAGLGFSTAAGMISTETTRYIVAAFLLLSGLVVVGITYAELVFQGAGSPSPTAGRTTRLVRSGIYAYCRNPSVHGKLLGVLSVGVLLNSFSFCFILVPLLLTGSLVEKVVRQEPQLVEVFGDEYIQYQKEVPLFVPWKLFTFWRKV